MAGGVPSANRRGHTTRGQATPVMAKMRMRPFPLGAAGNVTDASTLAESTGRSIG
jgi:hypothetical protein